MDFFLVRVFFFLLEEKEKEKEKREEFLRRFSSLDFIQNLSFLFARIRLRRETRGIKCST